MIDTTYYRNTWHGGFSGTDAELAVLLSRAEDVVDSAIYLSGETVADVDDLTAVKKAVCAQADYIDSCGGVECMGSSGAESMSLGKYSYSSGASGPSCLPCEPCAQARGYLLPTGLLYRGCST